MSHQHEMIEINRRKQTFYSKADEAKFKIILVGDSGVGKTSLFLEFTDEDKNEEKPNTTVTAVDFRLQPLEIDG
jgi:Ras-related protein Rab-8A